jgi:hypothetical protein
MPKIFRTIAIATSVAMTLFVLPARADDADIRAQDAAEIARMRNDIGRTFWLEKPNGKGIELCPSARGRFKECVWFSNTSLRIVSVDPGEGYLGIHAMKMYGVKLADGRSGYISSIMKYHLLPYEPVAKRKSDAEECARRGQPKVGMTRQEAEATCWGKPLRVEKVTTSAGVTERLLYGLGHRLEVVNGAVSAIFESE